MSRKSRAKPPSPFRYFHSAPELIREVVMLDIRFPLSLRNVEDLLFERGYPAAMRELANLDRRETGRWLNNRAENSHLPFRRR